MDVSHVAVEGLADVRLPRMFRLRQQVASCPLADVPWAIRCELNKTGALDALAPGSSVAVGVGSRGVDRLAQVVKTVVDVLKERKIRPFIVPAMGSHGGGTAVGQKEVLASKGITEDCVGVPIVSSMDVVDLGMTCEGVPVKFDRASFQADAVIAINRVKPHTDFSGDIESGLMKMLAVGFGKHKGAATLHGVHCDDFSELIVQVGRYILDRVPVVLGIGLVEDGCGQLCRVTALPPDEIEGGEKALLKEAKAMAPRIPFTDVDVLIVDEMGKNISGAGMDTNVIGRGKPAATRIRFIVALDLSEESLGNAVGMGLADIITVRLFERIDFNATYTNHLASRSVTSAKIPLVLRDDELAIKTALWLTAKAPDEVRAVRIRNTLQLATLEISECLARERREEGTCDPELVEVQYGFGPRGELAVAPRAQELGNPAPGMRLS